MVAAVYMLNSVVVDALGFSQDRTSVSKGLSVSV